VMAVQAPVMLVVIGGLMLGKEAGIAARKLELGLKARLVLGRLPVIGGLFGVSQVRLNAVALLRENRAGLENDQTQQKKDLAKDSRIENLEARKKALVKSHTEENSEDVIEQIKGINTEINDIRKENPVEGLTAGRLQATLAAQFGGPPKTKQQMDQQKLVLKVALLILGFSDARSKMLVDNFENGTGSLDRLNKEVPAMMMAEDAKETSKLTPEEKKQNGAEVQAEVENTLFRNAGLGIALPASVRGVARGLGVASIVGAVLGAALGLFSLLGAAGIVAGGFAFLIAGTEATPAKRRSIFAQFQAPLAGTATAVQQFFGAVARIAGGLRKAVGEDLSAIKGLRAIPAGIFNGTVNLMTGIQEKIKEFPGRSMLVAGGIVLILPTVLGPVAAVLTGAMTFLAANALLIGVGAGILTATQSQTLRFVVGGIFDAVKKVPLEKALIGGALIAIGIKMGPVALAAGLGGIAFVAANAGGLIVAGVAAAGLLAVGRYAPQVYQAVVFGIKDSWGLASDRAKALRVLRIMGRSSAGKDPAAEFTVGKLRDAIKNNFGEMPAPDQEKILAEALLIFGFTPAGAARIAGRTDSTDPVNAWVFAAPAITEISLATKSNGIDTFSLLDELSKVVHESTLSPDEKSRVDGHVTGMKEAIGFNALPLSTLKNEEGIDIKLVVQFERFKFEKEEAKEDITPDAVQAKWPDNFLDAMRHLSGIDDLTLQEANLIGVIHQSNKELRAAVKPAEPEAPAAATAETGEEKAAETPQVAPEKKSVNRVADIARDLRDDKVSGQRAAALKEARPDDETLTNTADKAAETYDATRAHLRKLLIEEGKLDDGEINDFLASLDLNRAGNMAEPEKLTKAVEDLFNDKELVDAKKLPALKANIIRIAQDHYYGPHALYMAAIENDHRLDTPEGETGLLSQVVSPGAPPLSFDSRTLATSHALLTLFGADLPMEVSLERPESSIPMWTVKLKDKEVAQVSIKDGNVTIRPNVAGKPTDPASYEHALVLTISEGKVSLVEAQPGFGHQLRVGGAKGEVLYPGQPKNVANQELQFEKVDVTYDPFLTTVKTAPVGPVLKVLKAQTAEEAKIQLPAKKTAGARAPSVSDDLLLTPTDLRSDREIIRIYQSVVGRKPTKEEISALRQTVQGQLELAGSLFDVMPNEFKGLPRSIIISGDKGVRQFQTGMILAAMQSDQAKPIVQALSLIPDQILLPEGQADIRLEKIKNGFNVFAGKTLVAAVTQKKDVVSLTLIVRTAVGANIVETKHGIKLTLNDRSGEGTFKDMQANPAGWFGKVVTPNNVPLNEAGEFTFNAHIDGVGTVLTTVVVREGLLAGEKTAGNAASRAPWWSGKRLENLFSLAVLAPAILFRAVTGRLLSDGDRRTLLKMDQDHKATAVLLFGSNVPREFASLPIEVALHGQPAVEQFQKKMILAAADSKQISPEGQAVGFLLKNAGAKNPRLERDDQRNMWMVFDGDKLLGGVASKQGDVHIHLAVEAGAEALPVQTAEEKTVIKTAEDEAMGRAKYLTNMDAQRYQTLKDFVHLMVSIDPALPKAFNMFEIRAMAESKDPVGALYHAAQDKNSSVVSSDTKEQISQVYRVVRGQNFGPVNPLEVLSALSTDRPADKNKTVFHAAVGFLATLAANPWAKSADKTDFNAAEVKTESKLVVAEGLSPVIILRFGPATEGKPAPLLDVRAKPSEDGKGKVEVRLGGEWKEFSTETGVTSNSGKETLDGAPVAGVLTGDAFRFKRNLAVTEENPTPVFQLQRGELVEATPAELNTQQRAEQKQKAVAISNISFPVKASGNEGSIPTITVTIFSTFSCTAGSNGFPSRARSTAIATADKPEEALRDKLNAKDGFFARIVAAVFGRSPIETKIQAAMALLDGRADKEGATLGSLRDGINADNLEDKAAILKLALFMDEIPAGRADEFVEALFADREGNLEQVPVDVLKKKENVTVEFAVEVVAWGEAQIEGNTSITFDSVSEKWTGQTDVALDILAGRVLTEDQRESVKLLARKDKDIDNRIADALLFFITERGPTRAFNLVRDAATNVLSESLFTQRVQRLPAFARAAGAAVATEKRDLLTKIQTILAGENISPADINKFLTRVMGTTVKSDFFALNTLIPQMVNSKDNVDAIRNLIVAYRSQSTAGMAAQGLERGNDKGKVFNALNAVGFHAPFADEKWDQAASAVFEEMAHLGIEGQLVFAERSASGDGSWTVSAIGLTGAATGKMTTVATLSYRAAEGGNPAHVNITLAADAGKTAPQIQMPLQPAAGAAGQPALMLTSGLDYEVRVTRNGDNVADEKVFEQPKNLAEYGPGAAHIEFVRRQGDGGTLSSLKIAVPRYLQEGFESDRTDDHARLLYGIEQAENMDVENPAGRISPTMAFNKVVPLFASTRSSLFVATQRLYDETPDVVVVRDRGQADGRTIGVYFRNQNGTYNGWSNESDGRFAAKDVELKELSGTEFYRLNNSGGRLSLTPIIMETMRTTVETTAPKNPAPASEDSGAKNQAPSILRGNFGSLGRAAAAIAGFTYTYSIAPLLRNRVLISLLVSSTILLGTPARSMGAPDGSLSVSAENHMWLVSAASAMTVAMFSGLVISGFNYARGLASALTNQVRGPKTEWLSESDFERTYIQEQNFIPTNGTYFLHPSLAAKKYDGIESLVVLQVREVRVGDQGASKFLYEPLPDGASDLARLSLYMGSDTGALPYINRPLKDMFAAMPRTASELRDALEPRRQTEFGEAFGAIVRRFDLGRLLAGHQAEILSRLDPSAQSRVKAFKTVGDLDKLTPADMANKKDEEVKAFKDYVYGLIVSARSLGTLASVAISRRDIQGLQQTYGRNLALLQINPRNGYFPSGYDQTAFKGWLNEGMGRYPLLSSSQDDDGKPQLGLLFPFGKWFDITGGENKNKKDQTPEASYVEAAYQAPSLEEFFSGRKVYNNAGDRALARSFIDSFLKIEQNVTERTGRPLTSAQVVDLFYAMGDFARKNKGPLEQFTKALNGGTDVDHLLQEMGQQVLMLAQQNNKVGALAQQGGLQKVGPMVIQHFGAYVGLAKVGVEPSGLLNWMTQALEADLGQMLVDLETAKQELPELDRKAADPNFLRGAAEELADMINFSGGEGALDHATFVRVMLGEEKDAQLRLFAMKKLLETFAFEMARQLNMPSIDGLGNFKILLLSSDDFSKNYGSGRGAIDMAGKTIALVLDGPAKEGEPDTAMLRAAVALWHEALHPLVDSALASRGFDVENLRTLALEGGLNGLMMSIMKLMDKPHMLAFARREVLRQVKINEEEGAVVFIPLADAGKMDPDLLREVARLSNGLYRFVLISLNKTDRVPKGFQAFMVVTSEALNRKPIENKDNALLWYARQNFGIRSIGVMASEPSRKALNQAYPGLDNFFIPLQMSLLDAVRLQNAIKELIKQQA